MRVRGDPSSSLGPGGDGGRPSAQHHWDTGFRRYDDLGGSCGHRRGVGGGEGDAGVEAGVGEVEGEVD